MLIDVQLPVSVLDEWRSPNARAPALKGTFAAWNVSPIHKPVKATQNINF